MLCTVLQPFTFTRDGHTERAAIGTEADIPEYQVACLARAGWIEAPALAEEPPAVPVAPPMKRRRKTGVRK